MGINAIKKGEKLIQIYMQKVVSSNVDSIGYSEPDKILRVKFGQGSVYDYKNVPIIIFQQFKDSESKGVFCNKVLKDYKYEKIS